MAAADPLEIDAAGVIDPSSQEPPSHGSPDLYPGPGCRGCRWGDSPPLARRPPETEASGRPPVLSGAGAAGDDRQPGTGGTRAEVGEAVSGRSLRMTEVAGPPAIGPPRDGQAQRGSRRAKRRTRPGGVRRPGAGPSGPVPKRPPPTQEGDCRWGAHRPPASDSGGRQTPFDETRQRTRRASKRGAPTIGRFLASEKGVCRPPKEGTPPGNGGRYRRRPAGEASTSAPRRRAVREVRRCQPQAQQTFIDCGVSLEAAKGGRRFSRAGLQGWPPRKSPPHQNAPAPPAA